MTPEVRLCYKGHPKTKRPYGWHCPVCQLDNARARFAKQVADGNRPKPRPRWESHATPREGLCKRGHPRVRRPNGDSACPTCTRRSKNARRAAEREKACEHVGQPGYDGVLNTDGKMICLACVAGESAAA